MNFENEDLKITIRMTVKDSVRGYLMTWHGKSKSTKPGEKLDPYFEEIMPKLKGYDLIIDFSVLDFMNSSTVPVIIFLATSLEKNQIKTVFTYDPQVEWQVASFKAFDIIIKNLKHISLVAK